MCVREGVMCAYIQCVCVFMCMLNYVGAFSYNSTHCHAHSAARWYVHTLD